jgi:hypothetical protein
MTSKKRGEDQITETRPKPADVAWVSPAIIVCIVGLFNFSEDGNSLGVSKV